MERKNNNNIDFRHSSASANHEVEDISSVDKISPPPLQFKTESSDASEEEKQEIQLKEKPYASGGAENPEDTATNGLGDDPSSNGQAFQLKSASNKTGLPDNLKSGVEGLSGFSMDDVNVHYNSSKPAQLKAHAYAQGTDIHLGPGQDKHLPHEAWHVVQQKQGRVQPTTQLEAFNINDDAGLEKEADMMGAKAVSSAYEGDSASIQRKSAIQNTPLQIVQPRWDECKVYGLPKLDWHEKMDGLQWIKDAERYCYEIGDDDWATIDEVFDEETVAFIDEHLREWKTIEEWAEIDVEVPQENEGPQEGDVEGADNEDALLEEIPEIDPADNIEYVYKHERAFMEKLIEICGEQKVGGLCNAMTIDWVRNKLENHELPEIYGEEQLRALVKKQAEYYGLEKEEPGMGLTKYADSQKFELEEVADGKINFEGSQSGIEEVQLPSEGGYYLQWEPSESQGHTTGHAIAIYKEGETITIMDQTLGQFKVSSLGDFNNYYKHVVISMNDELEQKKGGGAKLKYWTIFKMNSKKVLIK